MEATEILMSEHRVVEGFLHTLEAGADRLKRGQTIRPAFFIEAAQFSKGFTDGCHHRKEEGVLFKAMVQNGMPDSSGPIAIMLAEHEQGRQLTKAMRQAAAEMETGDSSAAQKVIDNADAYIALLRQHIQKEDRILFPLADRVIPVADQQRVTTDFDTVEKEETGEGIHEKYLALAAALQREVG